MTKLIKQFLVAVLFTSTVSSQANDLSGAEGVQVATLYASSGHVEGRVKAQWLNVTVGQSFSSQDAIKTDVGSTAGIKFNDGFLLRLKEKTEIEFSQATNNQPVSVSNGAAYFFSRSPNKYPDIKTPHVSASVRGTEFVVEVNHDETKISVIQGAVLAQNQFGEVSLGAGEIALTKAGAAPVKQIMVKPLDAVEWALYYPAITSISDYSNFTSLVNPQVLELINSGQYKEAIQEFKSNSWVDVMGRSLAYYSMGMQSESIKEVEKVNSKEIDFNTFKSSLYLSNSQVEKAEAILSTYNSSNATAQILAQKSVIALVKNQKTEAKEHLDQALKLSNESSSVILAKSYYDQANFDLDAAIHGVEKILANDKENITARIRHAELILGKGEFDEALKVSKSALDVAPNNENALVVYGFIILSQSKSDEALKIFDKANSINNNLPQAHLGRALALIKNGQLPQGRSELEIAVQLAPSVALYRSYLGKAFFEEKKHQLSEKEYQQAIKLDPNDPTPYLYRSFLKLSEHKPVEALSDIEASIKRNDNRSVYRSKLLVDQDEAVRGVSLGKIYNRVGFNELARVEAIKSLNHDYANYSAHFLLSDIYQDSNLNSNALVTENLLGRLLVPVNYNSNAVDLVGGQASFNEYTPLFNRPVERTRVIAGGDSASKDLVGGVDETITTNEAGFRIGYQGETRDGFRDNDFIRQNQVYTQGQYQLFEKDTLVWDATGYKNKQGDITVNTDPYSENKSLETKLDSGLVRVGYHRNISVNSHLVAQSFFNQGNFKKTNLEDGSRISGFNITNNGINLNSVPFGFDGKSSDFVKSNTNLYQGDIQHIYDSELFSLISGVSLNSQRYSNNENGYISDVGSREVLSFLNGYQFNSSANVNQDSERAYLYSKWRLFKGFTLDSGISYVNLQLAKNPDLTPFTSETVNKQAWDPKFGAVWQLMDNLSLRTVYAKSLGRTERGSIGPLEPTFVGGFNQVIDGIRGSSQDLAGVGIDAKNPCTGTYFGTSYQNRKVSLNRPFTTSNLSIESGSLVTTTIDQPGIFSSDAEENRISTYGYQLLSQRFSLIGNYDWEKFNQGLAQPDFETNKYAFTIRYFDPSGFFAFGKNTWRNQNISGLDASSSHDSFSTTDLGVGYEFDYFHGFTSLELKNIFDQKFQYSTIRDEAYLLPKFGAVLKFSYNF